MEVLIEESVAGAQANIDMVWVLVSAILVFFMQVGFGFVEAGLTRSKSVANIMMKNLMDMSIGVMVFFLVGFALAFGTGNDWFGFKQWALSGGTDASTMLFFIFQSAFAATAATIVSGAVAERTQFRGYLIFTVVITAFIYPIVVHWAWGSLNGDESAGWLENLGFYDFAGSTVVHSVGGWAALMGAIILGARIGKFGPDGKPRALLGHSVPFAVVGALILFLGWFGFNAGSEGAADALVPQIALMTLLAAVSGALTAMITIWVISKKPDVGMTANGLLAGLVGITAGCSVIGTWGSIAVGAIAGVLVVLSVLCFERYFKIDDPVGAISVHGICGVWGTLAVGIFAMAGSFDDGARGGIISNGDFAQIWYQIVGIVAVFVWVVITAGILFGVLKAIGWLRVSREEEMAGLDVSEHGAPGYGEVEVNVAGAPATATSPAGSPLGV